MEHSYPVVEFEATVKVDGTLAMPPAIARTLQPGATVTVRLTRGGIPSGLKRRAVTEEEIERIAARQLEPRENVLRFLEAEGALSRSRRFLAGSKAGSKD